MVYWSVVFLMIALVAGLFGFGGVASTAASIAQILFFLFIVFFVVALVAGLVRGGRHWAVSLASAAHTFWWSSKTLASYGATDGVLAGIARANLRSIARHSPHGRLRDLARERLADEAKQKQGVELWRDW